MIQSLRQFVRERAGSRCEYCHLPDFAASVSLFHVEHILAKQHGGSDDADNCDMVLSPVQPSQGAQSERARSSDRERGATL